MLYAMVICFNLFVGTCGSVHKSPPIPREDCMWDILHIQNLGKDDRAWCEPVGTTAK